MIVTRSPLRISLGGGGTDLPTYYSKFGGGLLAAAINKYVCISLNKRFVNRLMLKYSQMEEVDTAEQVRHPILRETLLHCKAPNNLEITSHADIPSGTGLGSSGSFTTALLKAISVYQRENLTPQELAERAYHIERERLGEPVGKQDPYIAAFGGLTWFEFATDGRVEVTPLQISESTLADLEDGLALYFTGYSRSASEILKDQNTRSEADDEAMFRNLQSIREMGVMSRRCLENNDLQGFAEIMNTHWARKRERFKGMSNPVIDEMYEYAMANGALGGKLIGAGGGGFLMFFCKDRNRLRTAIRARGLEEVRIRFDFEGTRVLWS